MNNVNVWRNDSINDSLNFDLPNQVFNTSGDDLFNQPNVWNTKSSK